MGIDWGTATVGIISTLLCILPFVAMYYNRVQKQNKMLQSLKKIAQQQNCNISQYEFCGDFVIGIDENRNFVFFFKQKKEEPIFQFVDLSEVQTCANVKKTRNIKYNVGEGNVIERVELCFKTKDKAVTNFELFDYDLNIQLSGELQLVEKWSKLINDRLKNKNL